MKKILIGMTLFVVLGFGAHAFAQWGMGYRHHGGMHHRSGWHLRGSAGPGYGYPADMGNEEIKKLEQERTAFYEATKDIRQQIYQKRLELRSEFAKKDLDTEKAMRLQKEISDLKTLLDQKRLDHVLKLKKINPDFGRGRMGYGMMGRERYGGCPNCPYGGGGSGYGMGPGMMGPGMMDPGMRGHAWRSGMGPAWSGRDYAHQYSQSKGPLEEKDARAVIEDYLKSTRNPNLELGNIKDIGDAFEAEIVTKDKSLVDKVLVDKASGHIRSAY